MLTSHCLLVPHLPTLLVDEHRGHRTEMLEALSRASERFRAEAPQAAVVLSAPWDTPGPFRVDAGKRHRTITEYTGFGVEVRYDCAGHPALARALIAAGEKARLSVAAASRGVDSGVTVPMHFLAPARDLPVVPLSLPRRPALECRQWGTAIRNALAAWKERVAFVVGGVLSYNLHAWGLRREVPEAREFDERLLGSLARGEWSDASWSDRRMLSKVQPEAELRHLEVLRGFLSGDARGELRCYEPGPGVGAALVEFAVEQPVDAESVGGG